MASKLPAKLQPWKITPAPLLIFILLMNSSMINEAETKCYQSIISFGDSIADTGNQLLLSSPEKLPRSARPPYGRTFFHRPTGRFSDGRLVIDFIAESLGLPFVQPSAGGEKTNFSGRSFREGVNFAVAGATVIDHRFYEERGLYNPSTNVSLGTQMNWFKQFLATIPDGRMFLGNSLVLMGEIGGNDYNHPLMQGRTMEEVQSYVPAVVNNIGYTIQALIKLGAETILVPGNFPIGCLPVYLTQFKTSVKKEYDPNTGCLNKLNKFSMYHNELLQKELRRLQELYPHVILIYADYYNAAMRFYLSPDEHGLTKGVLRACCGTGGPYNYNALMPCGTPPATSCDDPSAYASWDGVHFTEAAYKMITQGLLQGPYTFPQITTLCPSLAMPAGLHQA